jgi:hypothetical protein
VVKVEIFSTMTETRVPTRSGCAPIMLYQDISSAGETC